MTQTADEKPLMIDEGRAGRYQQCAVNIIRELQTRKRMTSRDQVVQQEYVTRLVAQATNPPERSEIILEIQSDDVFGALVDFHDARVSELAAKRAMESAERRTGLCAQRLALTVEDLTGLRLDEELQLDEISMEVFRKGDASSKMSDLLRQMSLLLADAPSEQLAKVADGQMCEGIGATLSLGEGTQAFVRDLAAFLLDNGAAGAKLVRSICTDSSAAKREVMRKPVRFLAETILTEDTSQT